MEIIRQQQLTGIKCRVDHYQLILQRVYHSKSVIGAECNTMQQGINSNVPLQQIKKLTYLALGLKPLKLPERVALIVLIILAGNPGDTLIGLTLT